ncbi:DUF2950 family protein [Enterobacter sp. CC120223-11]|uniref:DUF2950 family protein n=1 Tax=Enterobacter sp. CC120223-11 TaxID=1378073 RepID=UPI000BC625F0|nr:DUF2950 family protein [Enterobacter sp. CC120223-11]SNY69165.1 Protein of unknown function [Enterobacter sp. CC120223-11]
MKKLLISGWLALFALPAFAQQHFDNPDKAASALADAVATQNETALNDLLGENWRQYLPQREADPQAVARFLRDWKVSHKTVVSGDMAHLNVGREEWQLPLPMLKTAEGWHFDMARAEEEIQTREIGRNELSAIQAMHAYVDAQEDYHQRFQVYAKKLLSSEGQKDGLYWPTQAGDEPSPLGPAYSPVEPDAGYHGYRFRIIPDSDPQGFALIAWPVKYGETGIMSFMIDHNDKVWQMDAGLHSADKAKEVKAFAPEKPWQEISQ